MGAFELFTLAAGCFWSVELAFQRGEYSSLTSALQ